MNGLELRDEVVKDRIRQAEEFLDPSMSSFRFGDYLLESMNLTPPR